MGGACRVGRTAQIRADHCPDRPKTGQGAATDNRCGLAPSQEQARGGARSGHAGSTPVTRQTDPARAGSTQTAEVHTMRMRNAGLLVALLAMALLVVACGGGEESNSGGGDGKKNGPITIGAANGQTGFMSIFDIPSTNGAKL